MSVFSSFAKSVFFVCVKERCREIWADLAFFVCVFLVSTLRRAHKDHLIRYQTSVSRRLQVFLT